MKKSAILSAVTLFLIMTVAVFAQSPPRFPSPKVIGTDGFPSRFAFSKDAIRSYVLEEARRGAISTWGPTVYTGKDTLAEARGTDGEDILNTIALRGLKVKLVSPGKSPVYAQATIWDADERPLFRVHRTLQPLRDERTGEWRFSLDDIVSFQLELVEDRDGDGRVGIPISLPEGITQIHTVERGSDGTPGREQYYSSYESGKFLIPPSQIPFSGEVILEKDDGNGGTLRKAYNVRTGERSEEVEINTNFPAWFRGIVPYTDATVGMSQSFNIGAVVKPGDDSPLVTLVLTSERDVYVSSVVIDEQRKALEAAVAVRVRMRGYADWSAPFPVSGDTGQARFSKLGPGKYYFILEWVNGPRSHFYDGHGKGGGGDGRTVVTPTIPVPAKPEV